MDKRDQAIKLLSEERDGLTAAIDHLKALTRTERRGRPRKITNGEAPKAAKTAAAPTATATTKRRRGRAAGRAVAEKAMHA